MIEAEQLSKTYGTTRAIEDVTFSVAQGEILGFLGPNGAGKTTTMRVLTGYLPANSGTARVAGWDVHEQSMQVRQHIGYLPETPPLYPEMPVEGFLHFVARLKGVSAGDRATQVNAAIARCGLTEKRRVLIGKLSKGFRQRVGIAQAIVHAPPVIILDEPTVGLDPRQMIEVRNLIKSFRGERTIVLSTHILSEVSMTCSQLAIINRGRIVATGSLDTLVAQLTTGTGYELEVDGESTQAQQTLQQVAGVVDVQVIPEQTLPDRRCKLRVTISPGTDPGRELAVALVESRLGLFEMRRTRTSLEDVFLQLTTDEKTAVAPDQEGQAPESQDTASETPPEPIAATEDIKETEATEEVL
jgi:ABC-2 type transport system ATP-binding protein